MVANLDTHLRRLAPWALLAGLFLLLATLALATVAAHPGHFLNGEELANATVARELLVGDRALFLHYQHNPHCGGCSAVALLGWASFRIAGVSYLAWKAVPALWAGVTLLAGFALLRAHVGRAAGWLFVALLFAAPTTLFQAMLMAWGNHFEQMALVLLQGLSVAFVLRGARRQRGARWLPWFSWGIAAGLGFWICFGSLFAFPTLLLLVLFAVPLRRLPSRLPALLAGLALGLSPLLAYVLQAETDPFTMLYPGGGTLGSSALLGIKTWEAVLGRFRGMLLFDPQGLWDARLNQLVWIALWLPVLVNLGLGLARARRGEARALLLPALHLAAMTVYVVADHRVEDLSLEHPPRCLDLRYLVPSSILLLASAAAGLARLLDGGWWRRGVAVVLLASVVLPGLVNRAAWLRPLVDAQPGPSAQDHLPLVYPMLMADMAHDRPEGLWERVDPEDWVSLVNHRRWLGMDLAEVLHGPGTPRIGSLLRSARRPQGLPPAQAKLVMSGVGRELRFLVDAEGDKERAWGLVSSVLEAADAEERHVMATEFILQGGSLLDTLERPAPTTAEELSEVLVWPLDVADCALCVGVGVLVARVGLPEQVETVGDLFRSGEAILPADPLWRAAMVEGAGLGYGITWGWRGERLEGVDAALEPADAEAFQRGYSIGRARSWRTEIPHGVGPEWVP